MVKILSGIKDVDLSILKLLEDKDILSLSKVSKYANYLCNNEEFWKNKLIDKWSYSSLNFKIPNRTYKNFYLSLYRYSRNTFKSDKDMFEETINASEFGDKDAILFFIYKGKEKLKGLVLPYTFNIHLRNSIKLGNLELVKFFMKQRLVFEKEHVLNSSMELAIRSGYKNIVGYFISEGANDFVLGLDVSKVHGNKELIELFENKIREQVDKQSAIKSFCKLTYG